MEDRAWDLAQLADLNGDGLNEVLFPLVRRVGLTDTLYCLGPTGETLWTYELDKWINGAPELSGAYKMSTASPPGGGLGAVSDGKQMFVFLLTRHSIEGQARAVLLDSENGLAVDEYWHPGRLEGFLKTNLDLDPGDELIVRGYNNPRGIGHAAVAVLNVPFDGP